MAADLGLRVRWRRCAPRRGAGRLLWMLEQMATPAHATELVPRLWATATGRGMSSPDWPHTTPPADCRLDGNDYTMLLRERTTACLLAEADSEVTVNNLAAGTLTVWTGRSTTSIPVDGPTRTSHPPRHPEDPDGGQTGAAVFTRRGDYKTLGWLTDYLAIAADTRSSF